MGLPTPSFSVETMEQIRRFVAETFLFEEDAVLDPQESLLDAGVLDSMGVMELVAFLEEEFDIVLRDEDLVRENLDTLTGIASLVERRRPGAG